jgi:amino acid adenylation domain-containing protein
MQNIDELLTKSLTEIRRLKAVNKTLELSQREPIAIVGAACRYPGGIGTVDTLWEALREGRDAIGPMTDERWPMARFLSDSPDHPGAIYTNAMGLVDHIDGFDAQRFGIKPEEARHIDPQHRLLMEVAWEAIEDAGYPVEALSGSRTGAFIGIMSDDYGQLQGPLDKSSVYIGAGIAKSCAAGRLSFTFGLEGPALALDTACSSSLVTVHLAVQALRRGECDAALAGGVNLILSPQGSVMACRNQMLSPRGRCHTFDARADGYVRSEGCGLVMLKRLSDAERDGDRIYAVILGSAVNHDGKSQGLTAPSGKAQQRVIAAALADAGVEPADVAYVECHGTGTALGDPIEVRALQASYIQPSRGRDPLVIGAVKSNLGHMESAAGIGGLHKAMQVVRHREVPANLHFKSLNPQITLDPSKINIAAQATALPSHERSIAAVSSFGFSGTNAHLVLGSYRPAFEVSEKRSQRRLFKLSAHSAGALRDYAERYRRWLDNAIDLDALCYTAACGRGDGPFRIAFTVDSKDDVDACLSEFLDVSGGDEIHAGAAPLPILFCIDGDLSADWGFARRLHQQFGAYRQEVAEAYRQIADVYPAGASEFRALLADAGASCAQPVVANAIHRLVTTRLLIRYGVSPSSILGFGYGEFVAAAAAGLLDTGDMLAILLRGKVIGAPALRSGTCEFRSTFADAPFAAASWRDSVVGLAPFDDKRAHQAVTAFSRERKGGAVAWLRVGEQISASFSDDVEDRIFRWVHGDTNRNGALGACLADCYMAGLRVNWSAFYEEARCTKISLPPFPFQRRRYWTDWGFAFDPSLPSTVGGLSAAPAPVGPKLLMGVPYGLSEAIEHPVLQMVLPSPSGTQGFYGEIAAGRLNYLHDHRVFGEMLVPASLYIDLVLTVARWCLPERTPVIEYLQFVQKAVLGDEPLAVYCHAGAKLGAVDIYTRVVGVEGWTLNARATLSESAAAMPSSARLADRQAAASEPVEVSGHYVHLAQSGLEYGTGFQGIFALSRGPGRAIAKIALPPTIDQSLAGYAAHPVLLDGCLQAISAASSGGVGGGEVLVPAAVRDICFYKPLPATLWCAVEVSPAEAGRSCASLTVFDADGAIVLTIGRFETRALGAAPAASAPTGFADWIYEKAWIPAAPASGDAGLPPLSQALERVRATLDWAAQSQKLERHRIDKGANDALASAYLVEALVSLGLNDGNAVSSRLLIEQFGVAPRHERLLGRLLAILQETGCARDQAGELRLVTSRASTTSQVLEGRMRTGAGAKGHELDFFARFGRDLPALLTGRADPLGLLFDSGREEETQGVYQDGDSTAELNGLIGAIVADAAQNRSAKRKLRILEVGAGTGATTAHVLPRLLGVEVEYVFTDISQHFLKRARERFQGQAGLDYQLLDIGADPESQAAEGGSFDIVIAVNVLHATPDLARTVQNLNHYLRDGGLLIFKELTEPQAWVDLSFGLTPGWWSFTDSDLRRDGPLLTAPQWLDLLSRNGFEAEVANTPALTGAADLARAPEVVVAAQKRGAAQPQRHWLFFSNQDAECDALEARLRADGDKVSVVCEAAPLRSGRRSMGAISGAPSVGALLAAAEAESGPVTDALYAWTLRRCDPADGDLGATLERNVRLPLYLCQAMLEPRWRGVTGSFLTRGAQPALGTPVIDPLAALVWGHVFAFVNENSRYARLIDLEPGASVADAAVGAALKASEEVQSAIRSSALYAARLAPARLDPPPAGSPTVSAQASYVVTGGFGALGLETARELARQGARHIVLVGRDISKGEGNALIDEIRAVGCATHHLGADVGDPGFGGCLQAILTGLPPLRGVVHSVGMLADGVVAQQSWERYLRVFSPKVAGTLNLYRAVAGTELDFFILYSSAAAILGKPGQANHAAANGFMDAFAFWLRSQGRPGLSIAWGGWSEIGAAAAYVEATFARDDSLIGFIPPAEGMNVVRRQFNCGLSHFAVIPIRRDIAMPADRLPWLQKLLADVIAAPVKTPRTLAGSAPEPEVRLLARLRRAGPAARMAQLRQYLAGLVSQLLEGGDAIDPAESLFDAGLDSLLTIDLRTGLEKDLDCRLPSTLLHDNPSISSLAAFLLDNVVGKGPATTVPSAAPAPDAALAAKAPQTVMPAPTPAQPPVSPGAASLLMKPVPTSDGAVPLDIAIIGVAGRYPQGEDLDAFWRLLVEGGDAIGEVPAERWDHSLFYDEARTRSDRTYCRWGGFLDDIDRFDPLFFNLPPRMAAFIDPNERLFLETSFHLFESAGYTRAALKGPGGGKVGVFVGAMYQLYSCWAANAAEQAATALSSYNSIANRVSYVFDLNGPSVAVDTMCSSSLAAIDSACRSIATGECRMAVAGGVNLSLHPAKFVGLSQAQIIGSRPDSRSFSDGDGFLPAEAVGAVLLKALPDALADGDRVLAVIKSALTGHGGHSTGFHAPNAEAQADLIAENFRRAGVEPASISYVEAAANGTSLADAVEVRALTRVFDGLPAQGCAIGSVKANIGHAEAASGIAQLTKVLLQLEHGVMAPSIGAERLNPNIDFAASPFRLVREARPWRRGEGGVPAGPRRATISAFGAGGANAHLIIEEAPQQFATPEPTMGEEAELIVLSARTAERLDASAARLLSFLQGDPDLALGDIAYSLQRREEMEWRLAIVAHSRSELIEGLSQHLASRTGDEPARAGELTVVRQLGTPAEAAAMRALLGGRGGEALAEVLIAEGDLERLALHWAKGGRAPWRELRRDRPGRLVRLPAYPFARERYWLTGAAKGPEADPDGSGGGGRAPADTPTPVETTPATGASTPSSNTAARLKALVADALGLSDEQLDIHAPLSAYGLDSMLGMRLAVACRERFGTPLSGRDLFDHPSVVALADLIDARAVAAATPPDLPERASALSPDVHESASVLSEGQKGLWLLQSLAPGGGAYNVPLALKVEGALRLAELRRACVALVAAHPILATVVYEADGELVQKVSAATAAAAAEVTVLTHDQAVDGPLVERVRVHARRPLDWNGGPLVRIEAFSASAAEHIVLLTVHHLIFDGSSAAILVSALLEAWRGAVAGAAGDLLPVPLGAVAFHRFVAAEARMLTSSAGDEHVAFWRETLAEAPAPTLPLGDRCEAAPEGATLERTLSPELATAVRAFSRTARVNPAALFLAGFKLCLARLTGEQDIIVGMPVARRSAPEGGGAIGYFVNMTPVRSAIDRRESFGAVARAVQYNLLDALDHADLPFPAIVRALGAAREAGAAPLFEIFYAYQNFLRSGLAAPVTTDPPSVEVLRQVSQEGEYPLGLEVYELGDGFSLSFKYDRARYSDRRVAEMVDAFILHLEACLADPDLPTLELPVIRDAEAQRIRSWSVGLASPYPREAGIDTLFREQARLWPDKVALRCGEATLTYAGLDRRASALARRLAAAGVSEETPVGLHMSRSIDMVVAVIAILRAGGAYVPLDPAYPPARLAAMIQDCGLKLVVAETGVAGGLDLPVELILADQEQADLADAADWHGPPARPDSLAYIIYTSGSTGRPKGVMVEQRAVVRLVRNTDFATLSADQIVLHSSSIAFDAATLELWGALLNGAALVLYPDRVIDIEPLGRLMAAQGVTLAWMTARLFDQFVTDWTQPLPKLRQLLVGGDVVSPASVMAFYARNPQVVLINGYGPSENTTFSACHPIPRELAAGAAIPIGRPIANSSAWVLDAAGRICGEGVAGELYVGGDGVARGYLARPELNARSFVPDPFAAAPGARLYRTGDLARWRSDGRLDFLGRLDQQVKIRGFRVEPGEIEARLQAQPGLRAAAVILREDRPGDGRLVAYVTAEPGASLDGAALRRALARDLPDYMTPSAVVVIDALPLTPSGKLDRRALPAPDLAPAAAGRAPRTPRETVLAALFAELLGLSQVDIDTSFFDLGGHSLLATRLVSRIRTVLGVSLPIRAVFETPTVAGLACAMDTEQDVGRPVLGPMPRPDALPLSPAQQRLWFLSRLEGPSATYNIPLALSLDGPIDLAALQAALHDVVARHESLRTLVADRLGVARQVILAADDPRCRPDLAVQACDDADLQARLDVAAAQPIDITAQIPLTLTVLQLGPERHVLSIVMHHIASDGWSLGPLTRDLATAYAARLTGAAPAFAPLPVQYGDYTLWQRLLLDETTGEGGLYARQAAYWCSVLADLPQCVSLPTDRPRPAVSAYQGASAPLSIEPELYRALQALARRQGASLFMVLHAALAILLHRHGCGTDIVIGTPVAGRMESSLDDLIGFFVNTLVLRTHLSAAPTGSALLEQVRQGSLDAYSHQDLPFEKVVELVNPIRAQNHHPLFQVMLALGNTDTPQLDLPGLKAGYLQGRTASAKFDLTFNLVDQADRLGGEIEFDTALFDPATIAALAGRLRLILQALAADPDQKLAEIDILLPQERREILHDWNQTELPYPNMLCVHQQVEQQAEAAPDAPAVTYEGAVLSYGVLNSRANRLARHLIHLGVRPDDPVAVCLGRSAEMIVCLFAILKAGGAYLPLDPAYASERLHRILGDARPAVLLQDEVGRRALAAWTPDDTVALDVDAPVTPWQDGDAANIAPHDLGLSSRHLAYVIYTSGSLGQPKGVAVEHASAMALMAAQRHAFEVGQGSRILQFSSCSFDACIFEVLLAISAGACLCIIPQDERQSLETLWAFMANNKITHTLLPPALFKSDASLPYLAHLQYLFLGGEALDQDVIRRSSAAFGGRIVNLYGPTEATVYVASWDCSAQIAGDTVARTRVPIGRPIANARLYILDAAGQPTPPGVAGELHIGGHGLARGYLNQPGLTAKRFIADPFCSTEGARCYRTGDLAQYDHDGVIDFLGRLDQQVKIRGFRVEPGEIEARLQVQPGLRAAAVILREDRSGDGRLVAYVTAEPGASLDGAGLRRALARDLPDYMVPGAVILIDALPLTPSGKLDRKALPGPDFAPAEPARAPRTPREAVLAALFAELLGLSHVDIDTSFFDLGGHSLLATRLVSRIRTVLGVSLPIRAIFETPTVAGLGAYFDSHEKEDGTNLVIIRQAGSLPPLFCIHGGAGLVWSFRNMMGEHLQDRPVYALQARGIEENEELPSDMAALVSDYLQQILRIQPRGPYHLLGWSFGAVAAQAMATELQKRGETVSFLAMLDGYHGTINAAEMDDQERIRSVENALGLSLGDIDNDAMIRVVSVYQNCIRIIADHEPVLFHGGCLFIQSTIRNDGQRDLPTRLWQSFFSEPMTIEQTDMDHFHMLNEANGNVIHQTISKHII